MYKTAKGNHARGHINQRQIDIITQEILPETKLDYFETGIIAHRDQVNEIRSYISDGNMLVETVHKFQGREKEHIILSTVDDKITSFSDNPNLLNVAVSRAVKSFNIIVNPDDSNKNTNVGDLISYIEYNNFEIIESEIYSIFDYLYSQYQREKMILLSKNKRVSFYDSKNLMYNLICDALAENNYSNLGIVVHLPLKEIFKNLGKLDEKELNFVTNTDSHVDFMIYNKVNKQPVLAVEVDGYDYHKTGTKQFERDIIKDTIFNKYNLPLERFKTNGSGEKERLIHSLYAIMN